MIVYGNSQNGYNRDTGVHVPLNPSQQIHLYNGFLKTIFLLSLLIVWPKLNESKIMRKHRPKKCPITIFSQIIQKDTYYTRYLLFVARKLYAIISKKFRSVQITKKHNGPYYIFPGRQMVLLNKLLYPPIIKLIDWTQII